jgi:hypothetical protein
VATLGATLKFVGLAKIRLRNSLLLLSEEFKDFPTEKGKPVSHFQDANWVCDLAFRQTSVGT